MQLMPATARWVAGKIGLADFRPARVIEPETNITLGARYLKLVLSDLGHPLLASAAYNAGPGRARRWRGVTPLEGAIYAETIPFNETRDYVKKVMANTVYYSALLGGTHQPSRRAWGSSRQRRLASASTKNSHDRQHPGTRRRRLHRPPCRQRVAARGGVTVPSRHRERDKHLCCFPPWKWSMPTSTTRRCCAGWSGRGAVINLVGILHTARAPDERGPNDYAPDFARAHVELPQSIVSACREHGVRRVLHMSALGAERDAPSEYLRSKGIGEEAVLAAEGVDASVFRPSVVFGAEDGFLNLFSRLAGLTPVLALAGAEARFQPVYVGEWRRCLCRANDRVLRRTCAARRCTHCGNWSSTCAGSRDAGAWWWYCPVRSLTCRRGYSNIFPDRSCRVTTCSRCRWRACPACRCPSASWRRRWRRSPRATSCAADLARTTARSAAAPGDRS